MNYPPELKNKLAAEYVLGTLKGHARRRFERLLQDDRDLYALVETWTGRLIPVGLPREDLGPSSKVWTKLEQRLEQSNSKWPHEPAPRSQRSWRFFPGGLFGSSLAGALGGIALGVMGMLFIAPNLDVDAPTRGGDSRQVTQPAMPTEGQLPDSYLAVLPDGAGRPVLLATALRSANTLDVKVLQPFEIDAENVPVLWALHANRPPTLVGSLPIDGSAQLVLTSTSDQAFEQVAHLAVSIEARSARPFIAPRAGYLTQGPLVRTW